MNKNTQGIQEALGNIDEARRINRASESVRVAAIVSGSEAERKNLAGQLDEFGACVFNSDGSTLALSLQEKIGDKTREGNFLGTLLAYRYMKEAADKAGVPYRDYVTLIGMLFGRGERMSPVTQANGCSKARIRVAPAQIKKEQKKVITAIEEALLYFMPVVKYFEKKGFRGVLDKWGDETQIASIDLTKIPEDNKAMMEYDVIKIVSIMEITDELAEQKDWVVFSEQGDMLAQLSRNDKDVLIEGFKKLGIKPCEDEKYCAGISLGPIAVSYDVLDIAIEVFEHEIEAEGVHFDFDPYFLMALAMDSEDHSEWKKKTKTDEGLQDLEKMVPDFFNKVQEIKKRFKKQYGRSLNLKIFNFGTNTYWADIGQHGAMREKYFSLNDMGGKGIVARKLAGIETERDENGNIIVNSEVNPEVLVKYSIIVNSKISGKGSISGSVIIDSEFNDVEIEEAFSVRSVCFGKTVLKEKSGLYESLGIYDFTLEEGMRHVSVLTGKGKINMMVAEDTDLRDKDNTYNAPILGNSISFDEAYNRMFGVGIKELEKRRAKELERLERMKKKMEKFKPLRFGTSGLRALVTEMTDMECYINTKGFISFLMERKEIGKGGKIAIGGDRRNSTPRIMAAVAHAIEDSGCQVVFCGKVPSPTLAYYAAAKGVPSIMVTGSHIPEDRNGIKFTKKSGEVLKSDEADILKNVEMAREKVYTTVEESLFDETGVFKTEKALLEAKFEGEAIAAYINRYLEVFSKISLKDTKIVLYQHSAVGRDIVKKILESLGAEVIAIDRSEKFVPVDTEKVSDETRTLLKEAAKKYKPFVIISTDGDSDRPLFADENGEFLSGDKLGALVSLYLKPDFAAVPISSNDAIISALTQKGMKVEQTRIGSPYVIKAMDDESCANNEAKVVGWESNGGFLLGSNWKINGKNLKALPTRDAVLPILAVLLLAKNEGKTVAGLISESLPARYTHADVVDDTVPGCEKYTADMGKTIINMFSPKTGKILQADFDNDVVNVEDVEAGVELRDELMEIKRKLAQYFTKDRGFSEIISINFIDGIRIIFSGGDVAHIRPSGNAPEFRMYATADTQERANEIVSKRQEIVAQIVRDLG